MYTEDTCDLTSFSDWYYWHSRNTQEAESCNMTTMGLR